MYHEHDSSFQDRELTNEELARIVLQEQLGLDAAAIEALIDEESGQSSDDIKRVERENNQYPEDTDA